jgi:hypothetical protein
MKAPKKANPPESNPFVDGLLEWMDTPEGELSIESMDVVLALLEKVDVDAKARKLLWADGERLSIDASVQRIHAKYPDFPAETIEEHLISWLEMGYAPDSYSQRQLDELDRLTERWIEDHERGRRRE